MNGNTAQNPITYIKHPNDAVLESVVRELPAPAKMKVEGLVRNEKMSLLSALEHIGFLIASR